jgi:AcrR family transcriptional regulator
MRLHGPDGQPLAEHIAEVAAELFYRDGIHAVGVDRVADTARITKRTLYKHFRSKDELIAAALRCAPRVPFPESGAPGERIIGAFERLADYLGDTAFRGCPYIIFTAELTEPRHPARVQIERLLARRRRWFRERLEELEFADAADVAEELDVLFDGAVASAAKRRDLESVTAATRVARRIVAERRAPCVSAN